MASRKLLLNAMFLQLCYMYKLYKRRRRLRRWKIRPRNLERRDREYQQKISLNTQEMDEEQFFMNTRMPRFVFDLLLNLVGNELRKPKQTIFAEQRLSLTLLFLAQAVPIKKLALDNKLGRSTVRIIILETCEVLWRLLSPTYISAPTEEQFNEIADNFQKKFDVPNCVGAIDAKHIDVKCPSNARTSLSSKLMAVCDANYKFTVASVGCADSEKIGVIFRDSLFGQALTNRSLPLPASSYLSEKSNVPTPYYFVDNAVFSLGPNIMRPYPIVNLNITKSIFNYRLSRAHRVIENALGILTARWQILANTLEFSTENCETVVLACVVLHNFVMVNDHTRTYCPESYVDWEDSDHIVHDGSWRKDLKKLGGPLKSTTSFMRRGPAVATQLRDSLANYFVNEGAVPFQDKFVTDTLING